MRVILLLTLLSGTFAPAAAQEPSEWVERTLAGLTLRQKVAQMVLAWIPGGAPAGAELRRAQELVRDQQVGGFIVGVGPALATATRLNELQALADVPLLVAADLEWGAGARLQGLSVLPMNMAIGAAGGARYAFEAGRITGVEARAAGVHMAFAPVADVNVNPLNPVINTRAYGSEASAVAARVAAFIEGARASGLLSVAKHFPGHGDTEEDSHLSLPLVLADRARLDSVELVPFRAAISQRVSGVMTAHLAVPALEPGLASRRPATLSPAILTGLLRDELRFEGLIVTDALTMDGIRRGRTTGDVAVEAVRAGADVLLQPPSTATAIDAVVAAVRAGTLSEERIDASVRRILAAKWEAGLDRQRTVDTGRLRAMLDERAHRSWVESVAARSLTLLEDLTLPVPVAGRRVVHLAYDDTRTRALGRGLEAELRSRGAAVQQVRLHRGSTPAQLREAERVAEGADLVIFSSWARALPWKGDVGLPPAVAALGDRLAAGGAIVMSFGDPYVIRQLPRARSYLVGWSELAEREAARALVGEVPITGRLPVSLPPRFGVGEGLDRMIRVSDDPEGPPPPHRH